MLCALLHSLLATAIATQQSVLVGRIAVSRRRDNVLLAAVLGYPRGQDGLSQTQPRRLFSFAWQVPSMLLGSSIMFVFVGIAIHVYSAAQTAGRWGAEVITAICFTISFAFGLGTYIVNWATLEWLVQDQLRI
jgi:hypothetical protein